MQWVGNVTLCALVSEAVCGTQAKAKIMVVRDIERDEIEFISKTLNCLPISHVDHMKPEKLAHAELVESETVRYRLCSPSRSGLLRGVIID